MKQWITETLGRLNAQDNIGTGAADIAAPVVEAQPENKKRTAAPESGCASSEGSTSTEATLSVHETSVANRDSVSSVRERAGDNQKPAEGIEPSKSGLTGPLTSQTAGCEEVYHAGAPEKATMSAKITCPYCNSQNFVKRGTRKKKHEVVQLYVCRAEGCGRTFTAERVKGKRYPLAVIIEGMSYYNLGCTLEQTCSLLEKKFPDIEPPTPATLSSWTEQYKPLCRYERMRPYAVKLLPPSETIEVVTMAHRQLYKFRYHRTKMFLSLEEYKNRRFDRLKQYLDAVSSETPHQFFADGARMSEVKSKFDKADMIVKSKHNFANELTAFVLPSVERNIDRHDAVQRFMLANDSVTVATEVPVYIRREDIEHLENELKFKVVGEEGIVMKGSAGKAKATSAAEGLPSLLTGHIDLVQVRNGIVHILDYKPNASKEKPIEQLTWYALALSRLTGLRLFEFKCAWFDDKDYYEFYPLHVVKKLRRPAAGVAGRRARRRYVHFKDGTKAEVPRADVGMVIV